MAHHMFCSLLLDAASGEFDKFPNELSPHDRSTLAKGLEVMMQKRVAYVDDFQLKNIVCVCCSRAYDRIFRQNEDMHQKEYESYLDGSMGQLLPFEVLSLGAVKELSKKRIKQAKGASEEPARVPPVLPSLSSPPLSPLKTRYQRLHPKEPDPFSVALKELDSKNTVEDAIRELSVSELLLDDGRFYPRCCIILGEAMLQHYGRPFIVGRDLNDLSDVPGDSLSQAKFLNSLDSILEQSKRPKNWRWSPSQTAYGVRLLLFVRYTSNLSGPWMSLSRPKQRKRCRQMFLGVHELLGNYGSKYTNVNFIRQLKLKKASLSRKGLAEVSRGTRASGTSNSTIAREAEIAEGYHAANADARFVFSVDDKTISDGGCGYRGGGHVMQLTHGIVVKYPGSLDVRNLNSVEIARQLNLNLHGCWNDVLESVFESWRDETMGKGVVDSIKKKGEFDLNLRSHLRALYDGRVNVVDTKSASTVYVEPWVFKSRVQCIYAMMSDLARVWHDFPSNLKDLVHPFVTDGGVWMVAVAAQVAAARRLCVPDQFEQMVKNASEGSHHSLETAFFVRALGRKPNSTIDGWTLMECVQKEIPAYKGANVLRMVQEYIMGREISNVLVKMIVEYVYSVAKVEGEWSEMFGGVLKRDVVRIRGKDVYDYVVDLDEKGHHSVMEGEIVSKFADQIDPGFGGSGNILALTVIAEACNIYIVLVTKKASAPDEDEKERWTLEARSGYWYRETIIGGDYGKVPIGEIYLVCHPGNTDKYQVLRRISEKEQESSVKEIEQHPDMDLISKQLRSAGMTFAELFSKTVTVLPPTHTFLINFAERLVQVYRPLLDALYYAVYGTHLKIELLANERVCLCLDVFSMLESGGLAIVDDLMEHSPQCAFDLQTQALYSFAHAVMIGSLGYRCVQCGLWEEYERLIRLAWPLCDFWGKTKYRMMLAVHMGRAASWKDGVGAQVLQDVHDHLRAFDDGFVEMLNGMLQKMAWSVSKATMRNFLLQMSQRSKQGIPLYWSGDTGDLAVMNEVYGVMRTKASPDWFKPMSKANLKLMRSKWRRIVECIESDPLLRNDCESFVMDEVLLKRKRQMRVLNSQEPALRLPVIALGCSLPKEFGWARRVPKSNEMSPLPPPGQCLSCGKSLERIATPRTEKKEVTRRYDGILCPYGCAVCWECFKKTRGVCTNCAKNVMNSTKGIPAEFEGAVERAAFDMHSHNFYVNTE